MNDSVRWGERKSATGGRKNPNHVSKVEPRLSWLAMERVWGYSARRSPASSPQRTLSFITPFTQSSCNRRVPASTTSAACNEPASDRPLQFTSLSPLQGTSLSPLQGSLSQEVGANKITGVRLGREAKNRDARTIRDDGDVM